MVLKEHPPGYQFPLGGEFTGSTQYEFVKIPGVDVEFKFGDPRKDASALAGLYRSEKAISHLAGVAPDLPKDQIDILREQLESANPPMGPILVANESEIRDFYKKRPQDKIIVAIDPKQRNIIGAVTITMPGLGLAAPTIEKLVVDPTSQRNGVGKGLIEQSARYVFLPKSEGGLGYDAVRASVITSQVSSDRIQGEEKPVALFYNEGFYVIGQPRSGCYSWDADRNGFVRHDATWFELSAENFKHQRNTDLLLKQR